ncbi:MAG: hypothetical protein L3J12_06905 [Spirochaetales bacterium]|nr:hypothetical protein [Spirochaetales bacterium]
MKRIEIIANKSIQEDMFDAFKKADIVKNYTLIPVVLGVGKSGPRMGDHIWPEENFSITIYCDIKEAEQIKEIITELKTFFKQEGIKLFELTGENY